MRRKPLEPFFSRMGIQRLQPLLADIALKMENRLHQLKGTKKIIRLDHLFSAFSGDIIGRICLSTNGSFSQDRAEFLDDPDFNPDWFNVIYKMVISIPLFTGFPWIVQIVSRIPMGVLLWAFPQGQVFNDFKNVAKSCIREAVQIKEENDRKGIKTDDRGSLFLHLACSDMPESERSEERLAKEAQVLLAGGTTTTAHTIGFASYYILSRPEMREKLKEELRETMLDWPRKVPTWAELEKLPLLNGIVKESLRYGYPHSFFAVPFLICLAMQSKLWRDASPPPHLPRCSYPIQAIHNPRRRSRRHVSLPHAHGSHRLSRAFQVHTGALDRQCQPRHSSQPRTVCARIAKLSRDEVRFLDAPSQVVVRANNFRLLSLAQAEVYLALAVLYRPDGPQLELFDTDESDVKRVVSDPHILE